MMGLKFFLATLMAMAFFSHAVLAQNSSAVQGREIHLLKSDDGDTRVIVRFPLALAFSDVLAQRRQGVKISTPFLLTGEGLPARLNSDAVLDDYDGFGQFLLRDYTFRVRGEILEPFMPEYVILDTADATGSMGHVDAGLLTTRSLLTICASEYPSQSNVHNTLIVMSFYLLDVRPHDAVTIGATTLPLGIMDGVFESRIVDHRRGNGRVQIVTGAQISGVTVPQSAGFWQRLYGRLYGRW